MFNIAIIGAGFMGKTHADAYKKIENANVALIVDIDEQRGKSFAKEYNCHWTKDIETISDFSIDIVDICVPTNFHKDMIQKASKYVKNIICEKPLVLQTEDVESIKELVIEKDLTFMVAQVLRFWSGYTLAKRMLDEGQLGEIRSIVCTRRQKPPEWSIGNWINNRELSGGPTFDLIIHDIDYITWIMGAPQYVMGCELMNGEDCLHVKAELIYENATASIFGSLGMPKKFADGSVYFTMEVLGEKGMISLDSNNRFTLITDKEKRVMELDPYDAYFLELIYFIECIQEGKKPEIANIYQAKSPIEIASAIVRSSNERRLIRID